MKVIETKNFIAVILVISFFAMFISCANDAGNNSTDANNENAANIDTEIGDSIDSESEVDTGENLDDDLGEFDFEGYEFNMLTRNVDFFNCRLDFEEMTGEVLEDTIYERNRRIEERFNVVLKEINTYDLSRARNAINAGDNAYDMIMTRNPDAFTVFAQENLIAGFDTLTHVNLDKPYWDDYVTAELSISNKKYFAVGAFNLSAYDFVHVLMFNKKLIADYGLANPYELVKNGTWTYDTFEEISKAATLDLNGDGAMDKNDAYGFLSSPKQVLPGFWISAGLKSIAKDENDIPYSTMATEKFFEVFDRIYTMTWDNQIWFDTSTGANVDTELLNMFQHDQALFMDCTFFYLASLRNMESDFGILPYPKYNEQQEKYYSRMEGCDLFFVPISAPQENLDRTSVILEALSSDSAKFLVPVYYDLALKTKFTRDDESAEIIDILFENRVFDLGDTSWCDKVRDPIFAEMFKRNNRDLTSKLESLEKTVTTLIEKTVTAFEILD